MNRSLNLFADVQATLQTRVFRTSVTNVRTLLGTIDQVLSWQRILSWTQAKISLA